jgi:hypothetical protein
MTKRRRWALIAGLLLGVFAGAAVSARYTGSTHAAGEGLMWAATAALAVVLVRG